MRRLWIADVHANLPAFQAVIRDAGRFDDIVFLGDIIGAGPHPAECVDILIDIGAKAVIGNHDRTILDRRIKQLSPLERVTNWDDWAFLQLKPEHIAYLENLPEEILINFCGKVAKALHHPPGSSYLHPNMPYDILERCFADVAGEMIICGHSHHAIDREVKGRRFVCIPSAGQPRNGDPRPGYAIEEKDEIRFLFTEYDIEKTVADTIEVSASLGEPFPSRWINFVLTGIDIDQSRVYPAPGMKQRSSR